MAGITVGVLALQGAFAKHCELLQRLGVDAVEVRTPEQLEACHGLILPGGESTTMARLLRLGGFLERLHAFAEQRPVFGTCAGCILMAQDVIEDAIQPLGLIDMAVERNAFGRQVDSFTTELDLASEAIQGTFIRAPRIRNVGQDIQVHSYHEDEAVLVQQGQHLAATFHPELSGDPAVHELFVALCR